MRGTHAADPAGRLRGRCAHLGYWIVPREAAGLMLVVRVRVVVVVGHARQLVFVLIHLMPVRV